VRFVGIIIAVADIFFQTYFRHVGLGLLNRGVSFGAASEFGNIISIGAFGFFVCWYLYERFKYKKCAGYLFLLTLGGGVNVASRLVWGSVWDYICLPFLPFCFNLSDVLISLGVVSYILGVNGNRSTLRRQRNTGNQ
jgi:lipoprotein signal peptidase